MKYVYICPNCGEVYIAENVNGKTMTNCCKCGNFVKYSGLTDQVWNTMSEVERSRKIKSIAEKEIPKNAISSMIKTLAIIDFIVWIIIGFVLGKDFYGEFSLLSALLYWGIGFVTGVMIWYFHP